MRPEGTGLMEDTNSSSDLAPHRSHEESGSVADSVWCRLLAGCVAIAAMHLVTLQWRTSLADDPATDDPQFLPRLLFALGITAATVMVFRICFSAVWMTLIRGELDRHQRGESTNMESLFAVSVLPALALSLAHVPGVSPIAGLYLFGVVMLQTSINSTQTLKQHILRYSPGFGETRNVTKSSLSFQLIVGLLLAALVPQIARSIGQFQQVMLATSLEACRVAAEAVAKEHFTAPVLILLVSIFVTVVVVVSTALCTSALPLLLSVLVHAHLCSLQGHRFAVIREVAAVMTLNAVCLAFLGPVGLRNGATLAALSGIAALKITHNESRVSLYLLRLRQLR